MNMSEANASAISENHHNILSPTCKDSELPGNIAPAHQSQADHSESTNFTTCRIQGDTGDSSSASMIPDLYATASVEPSSRNSSESSNACNYTYNPWRHRFYMPLIVFGCLCVLFVASFYGSLVRDQPNFSHRLDHSFLSKRIRLVHESIQQFVDENSFFGWSHQSFRERSRRLKEDFSPINPESIPNYKNSQLVVAGKLSLFGEGCSIAQFDLASEVWNATECVQLNLYNTFSGGYVYDLVANHTVIRSSGEVDSDSDDTLGKSTSNIKERTTDTVGGELIVVGAFDTTYKNSQLAYCSVGKWNGKELLKVGEGLCNSALSKGMKITTASFGNSTDVFVAGSFETQVWNGDKNEFVKIYNLAHFNAVDRVWLPLQIGQITCSWCTVTVLALAYDSSRDQLHVGGKFNAIDGKNIPAGLAIYNKETGHLVAHPGGGLAMFNVTEDGVATALQLDEKSSVLYVMGSFDILTATNEICNGLAAYEIIENRWTCLADPKHSVRPTGGGNMLLTPYGLMVAGFATGTTTWEHPERPYTIALLSTTVKTAKKKQGTSDKSPTIEETTREFKWTWLPGFPGHYLPLHTLSNGYDAFEGTVFIGGDNFVSKWHYKEQLSDPKSSSSPYEQVPVTDDLTKGVAKGSIMTISQLIPTIPVEPNPSPMRRQSLIGYTIVIYFMALGSVIGVFLTIMCNKSLNTAMMSFLSSENKPRSKGISLDTLTYGALENTNIRAAYHRAMEARFVHTPHLLTLIDPHEIYLHRIIGEGTFGRVWSAKWRSSSVAVKEFVFAQAAVAGKSSMQKEIIDEIIGEAGMMAILRHPYVLQLFGCSLTAQAIWIVSELCSLGSLRQLLDNKDRKLSTELRLHIALHVAEGMTYLHNQNPPIIHRDLKSHNIFVHETYTDPMKTGKTDSKSSKKQSKIPFYDGYSYSRDLNQNNGGASMLSESTVVAKIGDWGSARAALSGSRTMTHGVGTACWLAPEVIKNARASKYSDVYSFGIVLWELETREEVYQGLETTQIIARVAGDHLRPDVPKNCIWKDIMVKCWDENPQNRYTFETIVIELNKILMDVKKDSGSDLASALDSRGSNLAFYQDSYQNP